ncbi:MAG: molecular chaperone HtpG, partial [Alphaproteobacteria bacterium]
GEDAKVLAQSPQLEGFRARGVEVLLLTDPIDEFWIPAVGSYKDKPLKSATQGAPDLKSLDGDDKDNDKGNDDAGCERLIGLMRATLGDAVKDVRPSVRLTDSAVCLVADDGDMDMHMERMLKRHQPGSAQATPRILEINPRHSLIRRLGKLADESKGEDKAADDRIREAAELLLDQARIIEGEPIADPADFSRRLAGMMERGLGT